MIAMEEQKIVIGGEQAASLARIICRGMFVTGVTHRLVGNLILIKHGADQEFKVEIRVEDSEAESGERTVGFIDIYGEVTEVPSEGQQVKS